MDNTDLLNRINNLVDDFKEGKNNNYFVKLNQKGDESKSLIFYADEEKLYEFPINYEFDYSNIRNELTCDNYHCITTMEYDLLQNSQRIRIEEKHDNHSDHFQINLAFYDKENNDLINRYGAELSLSDSDQNELVIHDLFIIG